MAGAGGRKRSRGWVRRPDPLGSSVRDVSLGTKERLPGDDHDALVVGARGVRRELAVKVSRDFCADDSEVAVTKFEDVGTSLPGRTAALSGEAPIRRTIFKSVPIRSWVERGTGRRVRRAPFSADGLDMRSAKLMSGPTATHERPLTAVRTAAPRRDELPPARRCFHSGGTGRLQVCAPGVCHRRCQGHSSGASPTTHQDSPSSASSRKASISDTSASIMAPTAASGDDGGMLSR